MPFSLTSGGRVTNEQVQLSTFKHQIHFPVQLIGQESSTVIEYHRPCKIYLSNEGPGLIHVAFNDNQTENSPIVLKPGIVWIEQFQQVKLFAKSNSNAVLKIALLTDDNNEEEQQLLSPLEVFLGEPNTGFSIENAPVSFLFEATRDNLGIPLEAPHLIDIHLRKIYEDTVLPFPYLEDSFSSQLRWGFVRQYSNDSHIWQTTITVEEPGRYFIGSDYNFGGSYFLARLDFRPEKVVLLSEIAFN